MKTTTVSIISIIVAIMFLGGVIVLSQPPSSGDSSAGSTPNNVSIIDGKQVIEITAKGGYSPRNTIAKANMPTVLKVKTNGTFDCSSGLSIPSIGYQEYLPSSGETLIEIPQQKENSTLQGLCSMGMYNFEIKFS
jgi:plastocyanin domain-containing protein